MLRGEGSSTTELVPTTRPAASMAARASFWRSPTTAGTATGLGPVLTTRLTAEPSSTSLPAGGSVFTASPAGTLALLRASVAPTTRPAPLMAATASASGRPLTSGTTVSGGPELTV